MFRIWKEASASKKDAIFARCAIALVVIVGVVVGLAVALQPEPVSWKTVMTQDSGIVNHKMIPMIVVETFGGEETYPEPSLLILRQDNVLFESEANLIYVSPTGQKTNVTVVVRSFSFSKYGHGNPTASLDMLAWRSDATLQSNLDAFLGGISVNLTPLEFNSYVAGRT